MTDELDALAAILRGTGQRWPLVLVRGPTDLELDVSAAYEHLGTVIESRFLVLRSILDVTRQQIPTVGGTDAVRGRRPDRREGRKGPRLRVARSRHPHREA